MGDTVNLAKRLQERAGPGQILLNETAYALVRAQARCQPLAPVQVKGRLAFEQIYEVLGLETQYITKRLEHGLLGSDQGDQSPCPSPVPSLIE